MRKLAVVLLSATLLSSPALAESKIVGTYSGSEVTSEQVMEQFKPMLEMDPENQGKKFSELEKGTKEMLVKSYINQKLLSHEAKKLGISNSPEFKEKLKMAEMQIAQQELIDRHLKTAITDKMISEEYKKMSDSVKGKKEAKASHILLDSEEKAKEVKKKLSKGSKFEALVKEYSKDEGSKNAGGEIGYVMKDQVVPEFGDKLFSMKKGEISDPVKTSFGWHIIKMIDMRDIKVPPLEEVKQGIKNKLSREVIEKYIEKLNKEAKVEIKL